MVSQKLVFARAARRYKLLGLPESEAGKPPSAALSELQRLAGEGFRVRESFYSYGLRVILENRAEACERELNRARALGDRRRRP